MAAQNTIKCSKCKTLKGTTTTRLNKLIEQFGSKRKLENQYVCRSCKGGSKPTKKVTKAKKKTAKKKTKSKKIPTSKIICSKCKKAYGTNKKRNEKLIATFGSMEEVQAKYVCRTCRKEHNLSQNGRMKPVKRKRRQNSLKRDERGRVVLPDWMKQPFDKPKIRPLSPEQLKSTDVCWRPDVWTENKHLNKGKGCCNGCSYYEGKCGCLNRSIVKIKTSKTKKVTKKKASKRRKSRK
jgi:hypothetical protein